MEYVQDLKLNNKNIVDLDLLMNKKYGIQMLSHLELIL